MMRVPLSHPLKAMAENPPNFSDYLTIKQAAQFLGVSEATLRRWDRSGKLPAVRHPMNGYRLYRGETLEAILIQLEKEKKR